MPSVYDLKPKFQAVLRPACARLAGAGITANQVTIAAFVISLVYGGAIYLTGGAPAFLFLLPILLFIRMALNAIDGMLAREFGQKSKLGAILNELTDVLADIALYLPFAIIEGVNPFLVILTVMTGVVAEMTGVTGLMVDASRRYDGPFGKSDRALFFGALAFLLAAGLSPGLWSDIALAVAVVLGMVTIINRTRGALNEAHDGNV